VRESNVSEGIERIYEAHYPVLCRMATGVTGSIEAARDAVQEGFARALSCSEEFRGDGPLEGWVWRIVLRVAIDVRRQGASASVSLDHADEMSLLWAPELPHPGRDPELDLALRALPARQRLVVFLRYFADLSHAEIAAFSGMQLGTVTATLNQAKSTLARRLTQPHLADKELRP
jgi:RNA polymerase sigma factor (sigma-70 family)